MKRDSFLRISASAASWLDVKLGARMLFKQPGLTECYFAGLATDFCVAWSALDARKAGFNAAVIEDACRGIDVQGSLAKAWADMQAAGVKRMQSSDIATT